MPARARARTSCAAVTPEPQYAPTAAAGPARHAEGGEAGGEIRGAPEGAVGVHVVRGRRADRAGDVAGDRVDGLALAPVPLPRPRVEQQAGARHGRAPAASSTGMWPGRAVKSPGSPAGSAVAHREPGGQPGPVAAVEHPHVLGGRSSAAATSRGRPAVASRSSYTTTAGPGAPRPRASPPGRPPDRAAGAGRPAPGRSGQVTVEVDEDRPREVPLVVAVDARRTAEPPPDVQQDQPRGQPVGQVAPGRDEQAVLSRSSTARQMTPAERGNELVGGGERAVHAEQRGFPGLGPGGDDGQGARPGRPRRRRSVRPWPGPPARTSRP